MQRKSENIEVKFGSKGSAALKADLRSIGSAIGQLKGATASAVSTVATIGGGIGAAVTAWTGGLAAIGISNDEYVDSISRLSNVTSTSLEEMSRLAGVARRYGVDIDDLRGSMIQFFGQAAAAAKGDSVAEEFEKIGISSAYLAENLDDPLKILLAVAKAQRSLTNTNRTGVLSILFGEDDSVKVGTMLDALGSGAAEVATALEEIDASGAVVTQKDVEVSRQFNAAMSEFGDVFRGIRMELAQSVLPTISKLTGATSDWLRGNRALISGSLVAGWERIGYAINDVVRYLEYGRDAVRGTWLYPVIGWAESLGNAAGTTGRILAELFDELSGTRTTREFKWIDGLASGLRTLGGLSAGAIDAAFAVVGGAALASLGLLEQLPGAIDFVGDAWRQFAAGFSGSQIGGGLGELGALFGDLVGWAIQLKQAVEDIANGRPVDAQFEWVRTLVDNAPDLVGAIRQVGNVGELLQVVGQNFDFIAAAAVPAGAGLAVLVGGFGGAGIAIGAAAVALGVFIAKLSEAHDWMNVPFRAFDGFMREVTGMAEMDRQTLADIKEMGDRWADELDRRGGLRGQTAFDTSALQSEVSTAEPIQIPAEFDLADIEALVAQAQLQVSGAMAMSQFPAQITGATTAADTAVRRASAAVPETQPTGVPIIIQLSPGGGEVTVYAPDEDAAQQLLDMYANAKRASATPGGLPFAGDGR